MSEREMPRRYLVRYFDSKRRVNVAFLTAYTADDAVTQWNLKRQSIGSTTSSNGAFIEFMHGPATEVEPAA